MASRSPFFPCPELSETIDPTLMNRYRPAIWSLSFVAILTLSGCSSELKLHMREARTALRSTDELTRSGDFVQARIAAIRMREEVRSGLASVETTDPAKSDAFARLLAEWESGSCRSLDEALAKSDGPAAVASLTAVKAQCTGCHTYAGRPGIGL